MVPRLGAERAKWKGRVRGRAKKSETESKRARRRWAAANKCRTATKRSRTVAKKGVGGLLNMRGGTTKRVGISGKKDRKGAGDSRKSVKLFN